MAQDVLHRLIVPSMMDAKFDRASFTSGPRDKAFKLLDIAIPHLLPTARVLRPKLFFTSVGFEPASTSILHGVYAKHQIDGHDLPVASDASFGAFAASLDDMSKVDAASRLDMISVLGCAQAAHVLDMICTGTFRPAVIHCADIDSFARWPSIHRDLLAKDYVVIGSLEGAELFVDEPLFASIVSSRHGQKVATFDVFDTLIARRCIEPWRVFAMVAERMNLPDFVDQRRAAEQRVIAGRYNFDDIYVELARHYQFADARMREVKDCEIACERAVVIPIAENLARVAHGDLLISDMYLSEAQIRGLLTLAGLNKSVGLLVSSHGKSGGHIWPKVGNIFSIVRHLGDNPYADGLMANRAGVPNEITRTSDLNPVESVFMQSGLVDLARLTREARLATWHPDPATRLLQVIQTSINFPLLLLASIHLARTAERAKKHTLLFCGRDCNLWHPLFDVVRDRLGFVGTTQYFMTSRIARINASDAYRAYVSKSLSTDGMVIDLCGTGWSTANLMAAIGISDCHTYFIDHRAPLAAYESRSKTPDTCVTHKLFNTPHDHNNAVLECANFAEHPMCIDMSEIEGAFLPMLAHDTRGAKELEMVAAQRQAFFVAMSCMKHYTLDDVFDLDDPSLEMLALALYGYLNGQGSAFNGYAHSFLTENNAIVNKLTSAAP